MKIPINCIDVAIPIGKTSLGIKKTRIRRESDRKIYPYRKHWKYPWRKCDCQGKCDIYWPCSKLKNWKSNFDLILTFRSLTRDLQRNTTSIFRQKSVKVDHEESHCRSVIWWISVKNWNTSGMAVLPVIEGLQTTIHVFLMLLYWIWIGRLGFWIIYSNISEIQLIPVAHFT